MILVEPGAGRLVGVWTIGADALLVGIVLMALAFRLRALGQSTAPRRAATEEREATP